MEAEQPIRILYIDDDPGISRLVQRHLERAGYAVRLAHDGATGLELARSTVFDAIALDYHMPGQDGLAVLASLVSAPLAPPVIFVTAAEEPRVAIAALRAGAFDYVIKDVQGNFLEFLDTSIRQSQGHTRLRREKAAAESELRESLDRLKRLTEEQALMLREVNHRVANSLQLISSLIELQARKITDPVARGMLKRAVERVDAVSMVHRRLYTSPDVEFVEMDVYLSGLVDELRRAVEAEDRRGMIQLVAEPIRIETDKAVSIGLIVNELVTNAVKYAYPQGTAGAIRIAFFRNAAQAVQLVVEDDGVGYPQDGVIRGNGLGSVIVGAMARTAKATVLRDPAHRGTRFMVTLA